MKVQFKYPRKVMGKLYGKGLHDIPDAIESDWFFQAQVKDGSVSVIQEVAEAKAPASSMGISATKLVKKADDEEKPAKPQPKKVG